MKLTVNAAGFHNSVQMGTKDGQSARTVKNAVFGGATKLGEDPVAKRREEARRQAWKVVENAWKNDRSVDDTIQSHRDSYAELENRKKGALAAIDETNQQKEALREQCGVDADSQEQQDLLLLEKEQDYKNGVLDEGLTDEEYDRLAEIHKKPLTGYQKQALELNNYAAGHKREIRRADYGMTAEKQNVSRIKLERLKTHAMVDAQGAADDIMDAANDEIIGMLVQEVKDQQDEKMDEAKEKADEAMKEKEKREENIIEGKAELEREFRRNNIRLADDALKEFLQKIADRQHCNSLEDFYAAIGYGGISVIRMMPSIKEAYYKLVKANQPPEVIITPPKKRVKSSEGVIVEGIDNCLIKFARCCSPLPGDQIIGFITRGHGVSIHKRDCTNVPQVIALCNEPERWINAYWDKNVKEEFKSSLLITCLDRVGLLADVSGQLANMHVMIHSMNTRELKDGRCTLTMTITVDGVEHMRSVMAKVSKIDGVLKVDRS